MNKVKRVKNENFTIISNVFLKDKNLSIKAKGFLAVVMGLPEDWEFSINGICSVLKEGKTSIYNVVDELKEYGYCYVQVNRDDKGRILGTDYTFFEEPHTCEPYMENPNMDNQPQLNIEEIKEIFNIKEIEDKSSTKKEEDEFIERMYSSYPTRCPKRNTSLGKTRKDKERIRKLLKVYSMDEIERVFKHEIDEKYEKSYMQNFSTFLNNFPDPNALVDSLFNNVSELSKVEQPNHVTQLNIGGVIYR